MEIFAFNDFLYRCKITSVKMAPFIASLVYRCDIFIATLNYCCDQFNATINLNFCNM